MLLSSGVNPSKLWLSLNGLKRSADSDCFKGPPFSVSSGGGSDMQGVISKFSLVLSLFCAEFWIAKATFAIREPVLGLESAESGMGSFLGLITSGVLSRTDETSVEMCS